MRFIPQILLLVLGVLASGLSFERCSQPEQPYITIITIIFLHTLLYWGGWYDGILMAIGGR